MTLFLSPLKTLTLIWLTLCIAPLTLYYSPPSWHAVMLDAKFFLTLLLSVGVIAAVMTVILHHVINNHLQQALLLAGHRPNASTLILDHRLRILCTNQTFAATIWGKGDRPISCPIERYLYSAELSQLLHNNVREKVWQGQVSLKGAPPPTPLFALQLSTFHGFIPWRPFYLIWLTPLQDESTPANTADNNHDDPITGLINADKFHRRLYSQTRLCYRYHPKPGDCFALCNLDRFSEFNQRYGKAIGDKVLLELAHRLKVSLRDTDLLSRTDGDEFSIIILHISINDACALLERIGQDIAASSQQLFTVSFGVSEISTDLKKTQHQARTALARSKNKGRNCVSAYNYNHFKLVEKND